MPGVARFRANIYTQRGTVAAVFRRVPIQILGIDELELPKARARPDATLPDGLVLVTGPTGSGKSTTLAAMISEISRREPLHIVTVEDPIEFLFPDHIAVDLAARGRHATRRASARRSRTRCGRTRT